MEIHVQFSFIQTGDCCFQNLRAIGSMFILHATKSVEKNEKKWH